ncbi:probable cinnamyl alcohol dehydrogenase [Eurytemora carolleeae]|uniref:probable cinnamyl alcohol dehydrogenase n=1 Tax=Eurytemora carolleeae TaxID=1294199 RepID=UPI000C761939|nr:probable cinnamyl alcohol dehydrogenase [Eurytemora carolleeae]|eukprot:XP_023321385.1 probable cinnamyl alcohol dehydrogenase [Eurytemora affinis]
MTMTYDTDIKHGHINTDSGYTYGGYSASQTVHQRYLVRIPEGYPLECAGPIFCAAITMYSPLAHWKAKSGGLKVGIIGIGGLGQMGVRLAKAMGNEVTAISTSPNKEEAARKIGADRFIVSSDPESMKTGENSLDLILNTVSAQHQLNVYIPLLKRDGTLVQLGLVLSDHLVQQMPLMMK